DVRGRLVDVEDRDAALALVGDDGRLLVGRERDRVGDVAGGDGGRERRRRRGGVDHGQAVGARVGGEDLFQRGQGDDAVGARADGDVAGAERGEVEHADRVRARVGGVGARAGDGEVGGEAGGGVVDAARAGGRVLRQVEAEALAGTGVVDGERVAVGRGGEPGGCARARGAGGEGGWGWGGG